VKDTAALLLALQKLLPRLVDEKLIGFLTHSLANPTALEALRNSIAPKK
jgi:hypothetical protein